MDCRRARLCASCLIEAKWLRLLSATRGGWGGLPFGRAVVRALWTLLAGRGRVVRLWRNSGLIHGLTRLRARRVVLGRLLRLLGPVLVVVSWRLPAVVGRMRTLKHAMCLRLRLLLLLLLLLPWLGWALLLLLRLPLLGLALLAASLSRAPATLTLATSRATDRVRPIANTDRLVEFGACDACASSNEPAN